MRRVLTFCAVVLLAANAYAASTLVYDGGGGQARIQQAMAELGIAFDLRTPVNPVTVGDLTTHDLLVIGWNNGGNMSGVPATVLSGGITGNILLTGHDTDVHVVHGTDMGGGGDAVDATATAFLSQSITFAKQGGGTGLVALGDYSTAFAYLPAGWGVTATGGLVEETVTSFTAAGLASGVFNGLTPAAMSNWMNSYHAKFTAYGIGLQAFEMGGAAGQDVVTVGVPEPVMLTLLAVGGLALLRRRR